MDWKLAIKHSRLQEEVELQLLYVKKSPKVVQAPGEEADEDSVDRLDL